MVLEVDNNVTDDIIFSSDENTISSHVHEYFSAVENGRLPPIPNQQLIFSMRNLNGETLLITSARAGHAFIVETLINDIDIEETDNDGWNALLNASHQGHDAVVRVLLNAGASVDQPDLMGWTPLMWACYKNRLEAVNELLKGKAHINVVGEEDGLTPLIIASGRGYFKIVCQLLSSGAHVNSSDKFGSTALIWAARRGHFEIVEELLRFGAQVDAVGMHASTALMLATRGNYIKVVNALIAHEPNVNIVDYNGLSALGIAAREGYTEIAQILIHAGAYVNTIDRFGNSILASAVRSGNIHLVSILLDKHSDVNAKDSESRTPLHLAIDKAYLEIVLKLLDKKPNLELRNKDGETALLRAVKNRDVTLCQLLVSMGAKLSTTDNNGDNALHLALRARSRRLAQALLVNPSDSKLLYRPNKIGETPYSIDQESSGQPILPYIFGPIGSTDLELKNFFGYDAYGDVLADVVCEPNLTLPLTIGLYAKWGSGKSLLLPKIRNSMKSFSRSWLDGMELYWSWTFVIILFLFCLFATLTFSTIYSFILTTSISWIPSIIFGISSYLLLMSAYGFIYYGSEIRLWNGSISTARFVARSIARFKVLLSVLTLNAPIRTDKELVVSPVSFLFSDDHRLSFIGGEQALINIVQSLFTSAEEHYGIISVRLFTAFNNTNLTKHNSKLQTLCGIPVILYIVVMIISLSTAFCLFIKHNGYNELDETLSYKIASIVFLGIFAFFSIAPAYLVGIRLFVNLPKRRIAQISHKIHLMSFERAIQKLQREVDLLVAMIKTLDAFTNSQTRMVVMIDGLDSCEQNKMIQILDALTLFFCSKQYAPFIVILAVDPHIIILAIQKNLTHGVTTANAANIAKTGGIKGAAVSLSEITGQDYMRNIVTMPFFLDHLSLKQLQNRLINNKRIFRNSSARDNKRSDINTPFISSRLSLRGDADKDTTGLLGAVMISESVSAIGGQTNKSNTEFGNLFTSFDYFVNMNPRTMHRIVNSIALTGRLMRTFDLEFSWNILYTWISLIEQWPYRMCWIIEYCCPDESLDVIPFINFDSNLKISELYLRIKNNILLNCTLASEIDRNANEFELILLHKKRYKIFSTNYTNIGNSAKQQQQQVFEQQQQKLHQEEITVGHVRVFASCTSNLDPYMRKQVREMCIEFHKSNKNLINMKNEDDIDINGGSLKDNISTILGSTSAYLFGENSCEIWSNIKEPLVKMSIDDIIQLVSKLNISSKNNLDTLIKKFTTNNLNGLVLQSCDLLELKDTLKVSLGDWTLINLLIESLRKWKPFIINKKNLSTNDFINDEISNPNMFSSQISINTINGAIGSEPDENHQHNIDQNIHKSLLNIEKEITQSPTIQINLVEALPDNQSSTKTNSSDTTKSVVGSRQNLVFTL